METNIIKEENTVFDAKLFIPCDSPAPLARNGSVFTGCQEEKGHVEKYGTPHKVVIVWQS